MTPRSLRLHAPALAAGVLLALLQLSCATTGMTPDPVSMPAARAGLRPQYRVFYDELVDYGDWILIEPYGFVFRPRTRFNSWSPYYDGFWSPSDNYGWVWVSAEPYGWATYHYGRWLNDDYQGWVWVPGARLGARVGGMERQRSVRRLGAARAVEQSERDARRRRLSLRRAQRSRLDRSAHARVARRAGDAGRAAGAAGREPGRGRPRRGEPRTADRLGRGCGWPAAARARSRRESDGTHDAARGDGAPGSAPTSSTAPSNEFKRSAEAEARRARTIMQQKQSQPDVIQRFKAPPADTTPAEPKQKSAPAGKPIPATKPAPMSRDTLR
jgi:hypothetical protein